MKERISMYLDKNVVNSVDNIRGLIPRSKFVESTLAQKVEQIKESGGVIGQV